jgi:cytidylate kinase
MEARTPVIAIDGPAAAGKTTVSMAIAGAYRIGYIESGRMYRLVAYRAIQEKVPLTSECLLSALCDRLLTQPALDLYETDEDTSRALRSLDVTRAVSLVAKLRSIRTGVTDLTRKLIAHTGPAIVEGRDIGTTVFPNASVKIFLTATPEVRAARRCTQEPAGEYGEILTDIKRRDSMDSTREHSPMIPAEDAALIDTSAMTPDNVFSEVVSRCQRAGVTWPVPAQ